MIISGLYLDKLSDDYKVENKINKNILATVDLVLDYNIVIHDIKLMTGHKGEYLKFPNDDKGRNIAFPINEEARLQILDAILEEYKGGNMNDRIY